MCLLVKMYGNLITDIEDGFVFGIYEKYIAQFLYHMLLFDYVIFVFRAMIQKLSQKQFHLRSGFG